VHDWTAVNGHWAWILVTAVSGILFLGTRRPGAGGYEARKPWWEH
jgi:hypothetical protein